MYLDLALTLARQGWAILPCKPVDHPDPKQRKAPYIEAWHVLASTDEDTIRHWWADFPKAIPGVHCGKSGLVVFDLEGVHKAHNGATPAQNAASLGLDGYPTLRVSTPSGGVHWYYEGEADLAKLYVEDVFVGDRKASNGYVIPAGVEGYDVEHGGAVKPLPRALLKVGQKATADKVERRKVGEHERNTYLIKHVGLLRNSISDIDTMMLVVKSINQTDCQPPLDDSEVEYMVHKAVRRWDPKSPDDLLPDEDERADERPATTEPVPLQTTYGNSDLGNAKRFTARWGHACRFVPEWGRWITWDGMRWRQDTDGQAERWLVEALAHAEAVEPTFHDDSEKARACTGWLKGSQSRKRIEDALAVASTAPGMHVTPDDLDGRKDLLNCPNGMVDLRTGKLLDHDPEALCTLVTKADYVPEAESERFNDFMVEVFPDSLDTSGIVDRKAKVYDDNGATRTYVQRAFGYSLSGAPEREQCLFMHYGASGSGKSTLIEAFSDALGDYQQPADVEAVLARKRGQHPHDLARLRGARVVDTSELDSGERLSESVVKRVTSGERINARFMRQNLFTYNPTWILHVTTNHGFTLGAGGPSMERRIAVIPWTVSFTGKNVDKMLREEMKQEGEAILAWAVKGSVEYHQRGQDLARSIAAKDVGAELFEDADPIAAFVNDALAITYDEAHYATSEGLYEAFRSWWTNSGRDGTPDYTKHAFGIALSRVPGFPGSSQKKVAGDNTTVRKGIRIRQEYTV